MAVMRVHVLLSICIFNINIICNIDHNINKTLSNVYAML